MNLKIIITGESPNNIVIRNVLFIWKEQFKVNSI